MRLVVGISGATGAIYGYNLVKALASLDVECHLIISDWAKKTLDMELNVSYKKLCDLAYCCYDFRDLAAPVSSGSFYTDGMVISPCSMKTLAGIAHGYDDNLLIRAASVTLKEHRKLVLIPRETPFTAIHLENMFKLAQMGVVIMPPIPAFYNAPMSFKELVDHFNGRVLDQFGIKNDLVKRWDSINAGIIRGNVDSC